MHRLLDLTGYMTGRDGEKSRYAIRDAEGQNVRWTF